MDNINFKNKFNNFVDFLFDTEKKEKSTKQQSIVSISAYLRSCIDFNIISINLYETLMKKLIIIKLIKKSSIIDIKI